MLQVLRRLQRDYVVEVYTQASFGIRHSSNGSYHRIGGQEYVQDLNTHIGRHMVLLADQDLAWTFSQMATADVFVHSKSTLSIAAGIVNTQVGGEGWLRARGCCGHGGTHVQARQKHSKARALLPPCMRQVL